jgi:hypothetical protein
MSLRTYIIDYRTKMVIYDQVVKPGKPTTEHGSLDSIRVRASSPTAGLMF